MADSSAHDRVSRVGVWLVMLLALLLGLSGCGGGSTSNVGSSDSTSDSGDSGDSGDSPPAAPEVALGYGIKSLSFSWPEVEGATHYKLYENPDGSSGYSQVGGEITGTEVRHEIPLHRRVNASYMIAACNGGGCTESVEMMLSDYLIPAIGYFKASNTQGEDRFGYAVALSADGKTLAVGAIYEDSGASGINGDEGNSMANPGAVYVFTQDEVGEWSQQAYVKASTPGAHDNFGYAVALSADGDTLAVGAYREESNATGINGEERVNAAERSGAVYVFTREGSTWSQQAYVKASNTGESDEFGSAVALSADGNTLAVGAPRENSNATGVNCSGDTTDTDSDGIPDCQDNDDSVDTGAVYLYTRDNEGEWSQQAYVKSSNSQAYDEFGYAVALSADGNTLAVGAHSEDSDATGVNCNGDNSDANLNGIPDCQESNGAEESGAVYLFTRDTWGEWSQQAYVKASNTDASDAFGSAVSLSSDGNTLAVGAHLEGSADTGIGGDSDDDTSSSAGAVYLFSREGGTWSQQFYVKASNTDASDEFGNALSLSADGNTLAVGAKYEASTARGIDGDESDNTASSAGAVYLFTREGGSWSQQAYVKSSNTEGDDQFGYAVSLSGDGNTLAVSTYQEASSATGVNCDGDTTDADENDIPDCQDNNDAVRSGAVYLY